MHPSTSVSVSPRRQSPPPSLPLDAALIAAEATLRRNTDVAAVFIVAPGRDRSPHGDLTVFRNEPAEAMPAVVAAPFAMPHWAQALLASTEGVR